MKIELIKDDANQVSQASSGLLSVKNLQKTALEILDAIAKLMAVLPSVEIISSPFCPDNFITFKKIQTGMTTFRLAYDGNPQSVSFAAKGY
ncbi:MAG: hypothetical protein AAGF01_09670 [Cyanobacteria bacterium P01_G01_bin.38]